MGGLWRVEISSFGRQDRHSRSSCPSTMLELLGTSSCRSWARAHPLISEALYAVEALAKHLMLFWNAARPNPAVAHC